MKIINQQVVREDSPKLKDLKVGQVFSCPDIWPDAVMMRVWYTEKRHLCFIRLDNGDGQYRNTEAGQQYGFGMKSNHAGKSAIIYEPTLDLGEPVS